MENKLWPSSSKQNAQLKVQGKREKATTHDNFFFFWPSKIFADLNCAFIPPRFPHVCSSSVTCHKLLSWPCLLCPSNTVLALPAWHSAVGWDARLSKTRRTAPHHCPYFCWGGVWCKWDLALRAQPQNLRLFANKQEKKKNNYFFNVAWAQKSNTRGAQFLCTPLHSFAYWAQWSETKCDAETHGKAGLPVEDSLYATAFFLLYQWWHSKPQPCLK